MRKMYLYLLTLIYLCSIFNIVHPQDDGSDTSIDAYEDDTETDTDTNSESIDPDTSIDTDGPSDDDLTDDSNTSDSIETESQDANTSGDESVNANSKTHDNNQSLTITKSVTTDRILFTTISVLILMIIVCIGSNLYRYCMNTKHTKLVNQIEQQDINTEKQPIEMNDCENDEETNIECDANRMLV